MQHVHADHVVLADAGLGPGWHVNFGVWRAMLRDMRGGSSSGGGAYADQLWSIEIRLQVKQGTLARCSAIDGMLAWYHKVHAVI